MNRKFVRQANLPRAAHEPNFGGLTFYMQKDFRKRKLDNPNITFCRCHLSTNYDFVKYPKGCYHCMQESYKCCREREAQNENS